MREPLGGRPYLDDQPQEGVDRASAEDTSRRVYERASSTAMLLRKGEKVRWVLVAMQSDASMPDRLRRIAYGMCGDWHTADDLTQTALVRLYAAWPRVVAGGREEAYARRVLLNAAIDASRRAVRRETPTAEPPDTATEGPDDGRTEERDALVTALQLLPAQQRAVVLLRHWVGLPVEDVAAELGIATGTVKSHTSRALAALRVHLDDGADRSHAAHG